MAKKTIDPLKAKQRKQKIMAIVLGVVFVGVAAFQVPRVMKMMKTPPNPHANDVTTTTAAPTGTPSLAAPTLRGAEDPSGATTGTRPARSRPSIHRRCRTASLLPSAASRARIRSRSS